MRSLRLGRDGDCHYVLDKELDSDVERYWSILLEKLQNLTPELKKMFDKSYLVVLWNISFNI